MFLSFKPLRRLGTQLALKSVYINSFLNLKSLKPTNCSFFAANQLNVHTSPPFNAFNREGLPIKKLGKEKEAKNLEDPFWTVNRHEEMFPTYDIMNRQFYGMTYKNIPILYINATRNNTKMSLSVNGITKLDDSAGKEGFKNTRKGTNLAGQATGLAFAMKMIKQGYKTVRVMVRGLGPGRMSSIKGLQLGGLNIVSITDYTITDQNERPRKQRKL